MIKWTRKEKTNGIFSVPYYTYSKKGVCLHLDPACPEDWDDRTNPSDPKFDTWILKLSCYTGGQEGVIATKNLRVRNTLDDSKYSSNLKSRAGKVAHKMVNQFTVRLANFKDVVEA